MTLRRTDAAAVALSDGRVLIVGGFAEGGLTEIKALSSAEIYDPATGTFSPTGSMTMGRAGCTATLLPDGRVFVFGGSYPLLDSGQALGDSGELYDPKTGTFKAAGTLRAGQSYGRVDHTATLLLDGRVLIVGGQASEEIAGSDSGPFASAAVYDPRAGTFSATGSMSSPRFGQSATLLSDGRVLIVGGTSKEDELSFLASAEVYDPATGRFSPTGSLATGRSYHTATLLQNGRVLVTGGQVLRAVLKGGYAAVEVTAAAELYDPKAGAFSPAGAMALGRVFQSATLLSDGRVLIVGGEMDSPGDSHIELASAETFRP
jgi:hypothetical protein